jgi:hypothetical protein
MKPALFSVLCEIKEKTGKAHAMLRYTAPQFSLLVQERTSFAPQQ